MNSFFSSHVGILIPPFLPLLTSSSLGFLFSRSPFSLSLCLFSRSLSLSLSLSLSRSLRSLSFLSLSLSLSFLSDLCSRSIEKTQYECRLYSRMIYLINCKYILLLPFKYLSFCHHPHLDASCVLYLCPASFDHPLLPGIKRHSITHGLL